MQIIGFNLTKVSAEKSKDFKLGPIKTDIQFLDPEKEKIDLIKDDEVIKFPYKFNIIYTDNENKEVKYGEISLNGDILLTLSKQESKELWKTWKKRQLPTKVNEYLINLIIRKGSLKALTLEEDLNLPLHLNFPRAKLKEN